MSRDLGSLVVTRPAFYKLHREFVRAAMLLAVPAQDGLPLEARLPELMVVRLRAFVLALVLCVGACLHARPVVFCGVVLRAFGALHHGGLANDNSDNNYDNYHSCCCCYCYDGDDDDDDVLGGAVATIHSNNVRVDALLTHWLSVSVCLLACVLDPGRV